MAKNIFIISSDIDVLKEFCAGTSTFASNTTVVTFGNESEAKERAVSGAAKLIYCTTDGHAPEDYARPIANLIKASGEAFVLVDNTVRGKCLAGLVAAYLDAPIFSGVNTVEEENGNIVCRRIVYGGAAQRKEYAGCAFSVATASGGIFGEYTALSNTSEVIAISEAAEEGFKVLRTDEKKEATVNLAAAKRIVDIGRGWAKEEDLEFPKKLASVLEAEVGCSRPVAENNKWMPKSSYLGITGTQVKPELIVCCGLSGQIQHIGGINKSKIIVAINKDKAAPVFKNCDFGLVGDMYKIIPLLTEKLS